MIEVKNKSNWDQLNYGFVNIGQYYEYSEN